MHRQDAARVLGVDAGATSTEVDRAFRTAARTAHPDLHPSGSAAQVVAEARMRLILEARSVLRTRTEAPARVRAPGPHAGWAPTAGTRTRPAATTSGTGRATASAGDSARRTTTGSTARTTTGSGATTSSEAQVRHAAARSIHAYRTVRSSALLWLALLLGAALACTEAARLDPNDGLLSVGATLLATAALASVTMAARAHVQLHATLARVPAYNR